MVANNLYFRIYSRFGKSSALVGGLLLLGFQAFALTGRSPPPIEEEFTTVQYFERGTRYYNNGQFDLALDNFSLAAMAGNSEAAIQAGLMYDFGRGVPRSFDAAGRWYSHAAEMGSEEGLYMLGHMEEYGEGRPKNFAKAYRWYAEAAALGQPNAQYALGEFYLKGKFVHASQSNAEYWLSLAAKQCHQSATDMLFKIRPVRAHTLKKGC
ncbi:hypothetical protein C2E25_15965 [Geothermobacter hydrogeniphilus]|uniref:Sel1 repeat-containing protein n=1 Tax=Geothermobacter hydrogeniphilus TaxID=1969733 RepID=A0A2K2H679_9BACT|nr:tetratricopeptide repeat protein [Geothermobacter hydrogeniphilus]PNU18747.1 hypothetical protein C2E25_15965 [Geothermobacter hydrogeniphilus]